MSDRTREYGYMLYWYIPYEEWDRFDLIWGLRMGWESVAVISISHHEKYQLMN